MSEDQILILEEAGAYAKVQPATVRTWLQRGKLKGLKAGKAWRVRKADLDAFLEQSATVPLRLMPSERDTIEAVNTELEQTDRQ